jgi:hypothetical protein
MVCREGMILWYVIEVVMVVEVVAGVEVVVVMVLCEE